jgi:hypothetical protein
MNNKKPCSPLQGPPMLIGSRASKEPISRRKKGEEKPEEELMGKRKSSPWLATTSKPMLSLLIMTNEKICIHYIF